MQYLITNFLTLVALWVREGFWYNWLKIWTQLLTAQKHLVQLGYLMLHQTFMNLLGVLYFDSLLVLGAPDQLVKNELDSLKLYCKRAHNEVVAWMKTNRVWQIWHAWKHLRKKLPYQVSSTCLECGSIRAWEPSTYFFLFAVFGIKFSVAFLKSWNLSQTSFDFKAPCLYFYLPRGPISN